ncbi:hypothetical protein M3Y95_00728100 [Aphelenchoides besseyi]|nr:hypothetical protein M3Y95_00728100 [Aphelenchoides besseyi]
MTAEMNDHVNFTDYFLAFIEHFDANAVAAQTVDFDELTIKFGDIPVKVAIFEKLLKSVGLKSGSRVVIVGVNSISYLVIALTVLRCQCVFIPINPGYKTNEMREYLERAQPSLLLVDSRLKSKFEVPDDYSTPIGFFDENEIVLTEKLLEHTVAQSTENAIMFFSSGTTGYPKLAIHTHKSLCAHLDVTAASRLSQLMPKLTVEDVCLSILPFFHAGGLLTAFVMLSVGVRLIVWDRMVHERLAGVIQQYDVTLLSVVPALFNLLVHFPTKTWMNVKLIFVGGDQLNVELRDQLEKKIGDTRIIQLYGTTEAGTLVFMQTLQQNSQTNSCGIPLPGVQIKLSPEGVLLLKTTTMMSGYDNDTEQTNNSFTSDGFLNTGDLATVNDNGAVTITGRCKDIIKIRGWQVSPIELERAIEKQFPVIVASCVFEDNGKLFGVVQLKSEVEIDTEQILSFIRENFVRYKHLNEIYATTEELDRTLSGKLCRWRIQSHFSNNFNTKST